MNFIEHTGLFLDQIINFHRSIYSKALVQYSKNLLNTRSSGSQPFTSEKMTARETISKTKKEKSEVKKRTEQAG